MTGRANLTIDQQLALGQAVRDARDEGVGWKVLEHRYGRSRMQLYRYAMLGIGGAMIDETRHQEAHP